MNDRQFYIGGKWVAPRGTKTLDVINPATEKPAATISLGTREDVDAAVSAARAAFPSFAATSREDRVSLLGRIVEVYGAHADELAATVTKEMGAPIGLSKMAQVPAGLMHFATAQTILKTYEFDTMTGTTLLAREPVGACGMITPWNWPLNQIACKVAPALACGCTMVLKPSEIAPLSGMALARILAEAGVPAGVFNLVNGDGPTVGAALAAHPDLDMISFTGSTRAGIEVARAAAPSIKRVAQELGGKSANVILDDVDIETVIARDVRQIMSNTGQSCNAPTRMLVPRRLLKEVLAVAKATAEKIRVGDPQDEATRMGPLASAAQWEKVQRLIKKGIDEGALLVTGGPGKPTGLDTGYYARPTIFAEVGNDMVIAREEIFGPVLVIIAYETEADAIRIANDTAYGLSGYVSSGDLERARRVARALRTGNVHINGAGSDFNAPFGGYKQSGNGREWGVLGFGEYLEVKAIMGYEAG